MVTGQGKVKSVLSGDTLVLCAANDADKERVLCFAYSSAPRLHRDGDELHAFESREHLRKMCVGKSCQFDVTYTVPNSKREYGVLVLSDGVKPLEEMFEAGWLRLRDDAGRKEDSDEAKLHIEQLRLLETTAKAAERGLWQPHGKPIRTTELEDGKSFLEKYKGKQLASIVEKVLSGDRILARIMLEEDKHIQTIILTAGIRAPVSSRTNPSDGKVQPSEEHGDDARRFVEERLLQRNVHIEPVDISPQGALVAHIIHPKGNIARFVLEAGFARCTDFHSLAIGPQMAVFRQAEKKAQTSKLGIWKNHVGQQSKGGGDAEVIVTRVFASDVIYIRHKNGAEKRTSLSSIRGPRSAEAAEAPYRDEAKEFTRKRLIGKHVRVTIDGSTAATGEYEAKDVATVQLGDKNFGLLLVQEGLATVLRHRRDDTDRSPIYDELLAAQEQAKEEKKGIWSGKAPKVKPYSDASESLVTAKRQLASLQRQKKLPAVVDYVKSSSRFVVLIPREHVKLTLVLSGIRAPKVARNASEKSEPFGQEGYDLANKRLSQRDVELNIISTDKVGGFIGEVLIGKESFAKVLVEEGLATVHAYSAEQSGNLTELNAAEQRAKDARKNIWADYDPANDDAGENGTASHTNGHANDEVSAPRKQDFRNVIVTHIDEAGRLKLQLIGAGTKTLESMMTAFSAFHLKSSNSTGLNGPPKAGDYVAAKFTEDGQWYRARIRSNDRAAQEAEVVYVDYGNSEKQAWSKLRPLPATGQFGMETLRAQAQDATLSLISLPPGDDYRSEALAWLRDVVEGRELVAGVDDIEKGTGLLSITLWDKDGGGPQGASVNMDMLADGWAMVVRKVRGWERGVDQDVWEALRLRERQAKEGRRGMWEYGDLTED